MRGSIDKSQTFVLHARDGCKGERRISRDGCPTAGRASGYLSAPINSCPAPAPRANGTTITVPSRTPAFLYRTYTLFLHGRRQILVRLMPYGGASHETERSGTTLTCSFDLAFVAQPPTTTVPHRNLVQPTLNNLSWPSSLIIVVRVSWGFDCSCPFKY